MNREKLLEKDKLKREEIKRKEQEKEKQRERDESENTGVTSSLIIKDGGNIYSELNNGLIAKRIIIELNSIYYHFGFEFEVDAHTQQVDRKEFSKLYRYYFDCLTINAFNKMIDILNKKLPNLFNQ